MDTSSRLGCAVKAESRVTACRALLILKVLIIGTLIGREETVGATAEGWLEVEDRRIVVTREVYDTRTPRLMSAVVREKVDVTYRLNEANLTRDDDISSTRVDGVHEVGVILVEESTWVTLEQGGSRVQRCKRMEIIDY